MLAYAWLCAIGALLGFNAYNVHWHPEKLSVWIWTGISLAVFADAAIMVAKS